MLGNPGLDRIDRLDGGDRLGGVDRENGIYGIDGIDRVPGLYGSLSGVLGDLCLNGSGSHACEILVDQSDEQIAEYSYPLVRYALFSAPADTATEEDLEVAREYAEALVEEAAGDLDVFYNLGQAAFEAGTCAQCSDISVPVGRTVPAFEEWAWDEARTEGEIGVIYAPEYGYFAVGYLGVEPDEDAISQIAVGDLGDYVSSLIGTEGYFLSTDPDATPAPAATAASSEPSEAEESSDPSESEAGETVADESGSEATEEAA